MDEVVPPTVVSQKTTHPVRAGYARYVFWVLFSISFLNYLDRYVLIGAQTAVSSELGFNLDGIGYITSAFLIVYTLGTIPLGIWADRTKRKNVVAYCVAIWSLATAFTALARNFATLFLTRMVLGIGEAGYFPAGTALMSDYFHRGRRSRIMSAWSTAQLFGILGGYGIGGVLASHWRLAFLFTGIPGLLLAVLIWRVREPRRNQADEEATKDAVIAGEAGSLEKGVVAEVTSVAVTKEPALVVDEMSQSVDPRQSWFRSTFEQCRRLLRIRTLVVLIGMQIFAFFVLGVNTTFLPAYLQQKDTFGFSQQLAGLYSGAIIVLAGIAGTLVGGYMSDWLNRRHAGARVLVCGIGFLLSAPAFALAVTNHNLIIFSIFFVLTALLLTVYTGPSTAATQDVVPARLRASALALSLLIAHLLGDAFAPALVGTLATLFDPTHGSHFHHQLAGNDLSFALLITCVPALVIAGLIGTFGARWMGTDIAAAEHEDRVARTAAV